VICVRQSNNSDTTNVPLCNTQVSGIMTDRIKEEKRIEAFPFCTASFRIEIVGLTKGDHSKTMLCLVKSEHPKGNIIHLTKTDGANDNFVVTDGTGVAMIAGRFYYSVESLMELKNILLVPSSILVKDGDRAFVTVFVYSATNNVAKSDVMSACIDMMEVNCGIDFYPPPMQKGKRHY
jgi:hypothetical protein